MDNLTARRPPTEADLTKEQRQAFQDYCVGCENRGEVPDLRRCPGGDLWEKNGGAPFANDEQRSPGSPLAPAAPTVSNGRRVITSADLGAALGTLSACEWYEVPGTGAGFWVYPASGEEAKLILSWSPHIKFDVDPEESEEAVRERLQGIQVDLWILQVIACCRTSDNRSEGARCFSRSDVAAVRRWLPYESIKEVVEISTRLGKVGRPDDGALRAFFTRTESLLSKWASPSGTGSRSLNGQEQEISRLLSAARRLASCESGDYGTLCEAARE